ncbi:hypothetical protein AMTRI_Chr01g107900 [Amborella trichopoda]
MDLVIRERITTETNSGTDGPKASIPSQISLTIKRTRCSILSTAHNMRTMEDAISLMCQKLNEVDPALPNIAEALHANSNGPQEELSFTTKEDVCVVCMSELSNAADNEREMPCLLHQYHENCISYEHNQSCPMCRHSLRSN